MKHALNHLREIGRLSLIEGLASHLGKVGWGTADMAAVINNYLLELTRTTVTGIAARLSGLFNIGLDAPGAQSAAIQLAALQSLSPEEFNSVVTQAWKKAHGKPAPTGPGYVHFRGEVLLDTLRRLKSAKKG